MNTISVIIHTKNDARTLAKAVQSVMAWAGEVLVIDRQSSDNTVELAKTLHAKVISVQDFGYVEPAKNEAISRARGNWIFMLEADEEIPRLLATGLLQLVEHNEAQVYFLPRKNVVFGDWKNTGDWPDYSPRLFQKGAVEWPPELGADPITKGVVKYIEAKEEYAILHNQYASVQEFVDRMNRDTTIAAQYHTETPVNMLRTAYEAFIHGFYQEKGYDEQTFGLALALLQMCSACIAAVKTWEKLGRPEDGEAEAVETELDAMFQQLWYWIAEKHIRTERSPIKRMVWKMRRKLKV